MVSAILCALWTLPRTFWYELIPSEMALWAMEVFPSPNSSLARGAKAGAKELYSLATDPMALSICIAARLP